LATPVFPLIEKPSIKELYALVKDTNDDRTIRLLGDTAALFLPT
jgi:hypothetical protein